MAVVSTRTHGATAVADLNYRVQKYDQSKLPPKGDVGVSLNRHDFLLTAHYLLLGCYAF